MWKISHTTHACIVHTCGCDMRYILLGTVEMRLRGTGRASPHAVSSSASSKGRAVKSLALLGSALLRDRVGTDCRTGALGYSEAVQQESIRAQLSARYKRFKRSVYVPDGAGSSNGSSTEVWCFTAKWVQIREGTISMAASNILESCRSKGRDFQQTAHKGEPRINKYRNQNAYNSTKPDEVHRGACARARPAHGWRCW
jgi:hypothetical protein